MNEVCIAEQFSRRKEIESSPLAQIVYTIFNLSRVVCVHRRELLVQATRRHNPHADRFQDKDENDKERDFEADKEMPYWRADYKSKHQRQSGWPSKIHLHSSKKPFRYVRLPKAC